MGKSLVSCFFLRHSVQVEYYETNINKTYIPSENFENRVTIEHLCELHISKTCEYVITVRLRNVKIVPTPLCYT